MASVNTCGFALNFNKFEASNTPKMYKILSTLTAVIISALILSSFKLCGQQVNGTVLHIKVHGKGLEGNLEGDSPDRNVSIYLPPSYKTNPKRHFPVVYFLHGFTDNDDKFYGQSKHWMKLPPILDTLFSQGLANEMIFVTPDANTRYQGSIYSNSVTTGNWEDFVAKELVHYIDTHYRTIPKAESRGLAGHSMGGYGALRIGEKYPDVFQAVYLISPAFMSPRMSTINAVDVTKMEAVKTVDDFNKADFWVKADIALAAAWSPNPAKPPLYLDMPYKDGQAQPAVQARWIANALLASLDQYIAHLKQLHAIAFDAGAQDEGIAADITLLDQELTKYGIKHSFQIYTGTHIDHVAQRIRQNVVPFFSNNLVSGKK